MLLFIFSNPATMWSLWWVNVQCRHVISHARSAIIDACLSSLLVPSSFLITPGSMYAGNVFIFVLWFLNWSRFFYVFLFRAIPVPSAGLAGYPWVLLLKLLFFLYNSNWITCVYMCSTERGVFGVLIEINRGGHALAFHHSHSTPLDPTNAAGHV